MLSDRPKPPLDFSYHFSRVTKARQESKIKEFYKYFVIPGIGNLAGGEWTINYLLILFSPSALVCCVYDIHGVSLVTAQATNLQEAIEVGR